MHNNDNLPNPFQQLFDMMRVLDQKIDSLIDEKGKAKEEVSEDDLLTVRTAAEYLKVSSSTLYQLTSRKEIPFIKRGKRLYFKKEDLRKWIEEGSNSPLVQEKQLQPLRYLRPIRRKLR